MAAALLAGARENWRGTVIALFQPAEEVGDGAATMVNDNLASVVGKVDVALAQHVLPFPSGTVGTRPGPVLSAADSLRITVHGRGSHGSMPQASIDPVVLAAMIIIRLQTIVAREIAPTEPAVVTGASPPKHCNGRDSLRRCCRQTEHCHDGATAVSSTLAEHGQATTELGDRDRQRHTEGGEQPRGVAPLCGDRAEYRRSHRH